MNLYQHTVFENHRRSFPKNVYMLSGQKLFLKWSNNVTRQVNFNSTKIGGKYQSLKQCAAQFFSILNPLTFSEIQYIF